MANPSPVSHFHQPVIMNPASPHPLPKFSACNESHLEVRVGSFHPSATSEMVSLYPQQLLKKSMSMFQGLLYSSLSRLWATMLPTSSGRRMGKAASKNGPSIRLWPPRPTAGLWRNLWRHSSSPFSSRKLKRARTLLQVCSESFLSTASKSGVVLGGEGRALLRGSQKQLWSYQMGLERKVLKPKKMPPRLTFCRCCSVSPARRRTFAFCFSLELISTNYSVLGPLRSLIKYLDLQRPRMAWEILVGMWV